MLREALALYVYLVLIVHSTDVTRSQTDDTDWEHIKPKPYGAL